MSRRKSLETPREERENPIRRWSERKLQSQEPSPEKPAPEPEVEAEALDEAPPTDIDMPPLDTLTSESDYSGFLSPGVSKELQRLALRQLFGATKFNVRDGMDDYDEDFTSFTKLGDTITSDLRHRWEMERQRAEAEARASGDGEVTKTSAHESLQEEDESGGGEEKDHADGTRAESEKNATNGQEQG